MDIQFLSLALIAFIAFCVLLFGAIYFTDFLRAGCETPFGKFFLEARGKSKKRIPSRDKTLLE